MSTEGVVAATVSSGVADPDALVAELFAAEARSLVRLAGLFCDDRDAAEDLVQEAFIRLHRSAGTIKDSGRAPAFLRSIVINLARDHNRRGLMSLRHRNTMSLPAEPSTLEEDAIDNEADRAVLAAVRQLADRQRSCLILRYYLGLSESEIAETLGISRNSVKTHCRRGLIALGAALEERG
jgi:RNA polymerase sigma-70 factor (sigma-E family)